MFSFLQNIFPRSARAVSESEPGLPGVPGSVTLRNDEEIAFGGHSTSQVKAVNGGSHSNAGNSVPIQLRTVVGAFPETLKAAVQTPPDPQMHAIIPLPLIASQLSRGSVHISFAELRSGSPKGVFSSSPIFDKKRVKLPLRDILVYVKPIRRPAQQKVEMPDDIPALFTSDGRAAVPHCTQISTDDLSPQLQVAEEAGESESPRETELADPEPRSDEVCQLLKMPGIAPVDDIIRENSTDQNSSVSESSISAPTDDAEISCNLEKSVDRKESQSENKTDADSPAETLPKLHSIDAEIRAEKRIKVALRDIAENFPDEIKAEAFAAGGEAVFEIPLYEIAPKMTRGRIEFSWAQLHGWVSPALPPTNNGAIQIIVPLKEIIPPFMAAHRRLNGESRKVVADDSIPDVFRGRGGTALHVVKDPEPESDQAVAKGEDEAEENAFNGWHLRDFMEEATSLDGVEGVVVASHDGLVVAERMPESVDGSALAAFLPEMVGRTADYLRKAQIGVPDWMVLQVDGRMLQINKAGELYLAVLGETGRPLPRKKLREILHRISEVQPAHQ